MDYLLMKDWINLWFNSETYGSFSHQRFHLFDARDSKITKITKITRGFPGLSGDSGFHQVLVLLFPDNFIGLSQ